MKSVSVCRFMGVTAGFLHIDCASLYEWTIFIYLEISLGMLLVLVFLKGDVIYKL